MAKNNYYKAKDGQTYVSKEVARQYGVDTNTGLGGPGSQTTSTSSSSSTPSPTAQTYKSYVKTADNDTVYGIGSDGSRKAFSSWDELLGSNQGQAPQIDTVKYIPGSTPAELGLTYNESADDAAIRAAEEKALGIYPTEAPDEAAIRKQTMARFQSEIDMMNKIYAEEKARVSSQYQDMGNRRIGENRALQANSGMLGQVSGEAEKSMLMADNANKLNSAVGEVENDRLLKISAIMREARDASQTDYTNKLAAYKEGAAATVEYLKGRKTAKETAVRNVVKSAILKGLDLTELDLTQLAKSLGVDPQTIKEIYLEEKAAIAAAEAEARQKNSFTLGEGEVRYDGEGNILGVGADKDTRTSSQKEYEYAVSQGYKGSFMDFNTDTDNDGLTPYQKFQATQGLRKELSTNTSSARTVKQQYSLMKETMDRIDRGENTDLNASTQAIIATFNKILDPNSVVREGEYDRTADGQSIIANIEGKLMRLQEGGAGITKESLKEVVELGKLLAESYSSHVEQQNEIIRQNAREFGLDPDLITGDDDPLGILGDESDPLGLGFSNVGADTQQGFIGPLKEGQTLYLKTLGPITGLDGSPLWRHGLDIDLKKGDPVRNAVTGKVLAVAPNGGFGLQVKVKGVDGREYWYSHLDGANVKVGQTIPAGSMLGRGGNSGKTIAMGGGDGSHLDLTVKQNGKYMPPRQIKRLLDNIYV
jgi:murein DD-endopeptidase MepM/ murein hydrolase activator NlpD